MDYDIPENVRALIASHITAVVQLELLLLLHADPSRPRTATDIGNQMRVDPNWVFIHLRTLCSAGLLTCSEGGDPEFRYAPATPDLAAAVDGLARAYADRRVTIIGMIFAKPVDPIRTFSDAFRLRRDKDQ